MSTKTRINVSRQEVAERQAGLSLRSSEKHEYSRALNIWASPNTVQGDVREKWEVPTYIQSNGAIETGSSITVSGRFADYADDFGNWSVKRPMKKYMVGSWSDVDGPCYVARANKLPGSDLFRGISDDDKTVFRLDNQGTPIVLDEVTGIPYRITVRAGKLVPTPIV